MRRLGWTVMGLGALFVVLGTVGAVLLGPDSRFTTGPHRVDTSGTVIVTQPGAITYRGLQVDVLAEVPVNKPVFVGLGNSVDVQDYVAQTERIEVTSFSTPWELTTVEVEGQEGLPGAPTALDWWIADSAGLGGASISTTLPDETVSLAIVAVGATNLSGLEVTFAYGVKGGFAMSLALVFLGAGGLLGGHALRRGHRLFAEREDSDDVEVVEEVVYVYIDEDGVEHEITAQEAAELQAQEEHDDASDAQAGPGPADDEQAGHEPADEGGAPPTAPAPEPGRPPAVAKVITAADIVREHGGDSVAPARVEPAEKPEVEPPVREVEPSVPEPEKVVYVFVDDDGVEHEVAEDELDDYEVVDDEEDR
ncbi:hypothetical protein [Aeromicrobium sp. CTD01-1L150]|uniref:hypothetical protein n=1 Tax=Aeromicrobium sp. CTD01-1L150 TaxID=3341830 RepID=UPI0035C0478A